MRLAIANCELQLKMLIVIVVIVVVVALLSSFCCV